MSRIVKEELESKEEISKLAKRLTSTNWELARTNEQLRIIDQRKSEFVSIVSHQLRTPITAIKGYASLVLEDSFGKLPDAIKAPVEKIFISSTRLSNMVTDFLDISKIEQGTMSYNFASVDIAATLKDLVEEFTTVATQKNLELTLTVPKDEPFIVTADEGKLRQILSNLIDNSIKYTPTGGVHITIEKDNVHHGAGRANAAELHAEIADADLVITTYATAVRDIEALSATTWRTLVLDEAQAIKNPASDTAQQLRRLPARTRLALTGTPIENGVGDLWAILDFTNPGLVGPRPAFIAQLAGDSETALRALNGILLFRRSKTEPEVAAELPDKIDELDHCTMTPEQIGLYQAVLDDLLAKAADPVAGANKGAILAAITALKQICNHPAAYHDDGLPLAGRSGKLARLEEIVESVFAAGERVLIFTHFATWGRRLAAHLSEVTELPIACYDGDLSRATRDRLVTKFQTGQGPGAMVLSLKAGGTGLNLTAANHVVLYDRWWNPAIEDQARDRAWRIGQTRTVISHRLVCPGTVDERVEEVVEGKRHIAQLVLPKSSSIADLDSDQLRLAFGLRPDQLLTGDEQ